MNALMETQNHHELIEAFERETRSPFIIKLIHLPKKRRPIPEQDPREEQGQVWWNMEPDCTYEPEPANVEQRLRRQMGLPTIHQGETPEEWKARGNIVKVLPPGQALAIGGVYLEEHRYESYNTKKSKRAALI
jgi:hypothetical protein